MRIDKDKKNVLTRRHEFIFGIPKPTFIQSIAAENTAIFIQSNVVWTKILLKIAQYFSAQNLKPAKKSRAKESESSTQIIPAFSLFGLL